MLRALGVFYDSNANYSAEDFYNKNVEEPIRITVTYEDLSGQEQDLYRSYIDNNLLTVEKVLTFPRDRTSQKYYGNVRRYLGFTNIRQANAIGDKRTAYRRQKEQEGFHELPELRGTCSGQEILDALQAWEAAHPELLEAARDEGQFFGFKEVGEARLERFTRYVFIPAVRDAGQDAEEGKGNVITELMDIVIRSAFESREDIREFKERTRNQYRQLVSPAEGLDELQQVERELSESLGLFAPGASLHINWDVSRMLSIPDPSASVELEEDDYCSPVDRVGHGLQRAFIMTMLQYLSLTQARLISCMDVGENGAQAEVDRQIAVGPSIILGIEEAELYQHPTRQRHLANIFKGLSEHCPEGLQNIQILYTTHSPLFVGLDRFECVRIFRRVVEEPGNPKAMKIIQANFNDIVRRKEEIDGVADGSYSVDGERARLKTLMTPWTNEGFFTEMVVLVEGEEDLAAITGTAQKAGVSFESEDIAIIPCNGKGNLPKAALIFEAFEIPAYLIWDGDKGKGANGKADINRSLLRLFQAEEHEFPPTKIEECFACFESNMTDLLKCEIGEETYQNILEEIKDEYGFQKNDQAMKNPSAVEQMLRRAEERGATCSSLFEIVEKIIDKRGAIR